MTVPDAGPSALPIASLHSLNAGAAGFSDPDLRLPDDWQWVPLGALAEFVNGDRSENYPTQADRVPTGIPFINTGHIEENGRLTTLGMDYITRASFDRLRSGKVQCGDILYCLRGSTIGKTARNHFAEGAIASSLVIIRANEYACQDYLYFYLISPLGKQLVAQHDNGSAQPNLSVRVLAGYPVPLPPPSEQRAIARILGTLDDKIELNRKMNATLEAMARALFTSWFVDFDPVRAKAEGRTPNGMDAETAQLFPSEFSESELGLIPKGWRVTELRDLTSYMTRGLAPAYLESGGVCVLNQKCIRDRRVDFSRARRHDPSRKSVEGRVIEKLDILVNSTGVGTLGRVAQIWSLPEPTVVDSHVTIVRAAQGTDPWYLGTLILGRETEIEALGEGSTGQTELSRVRLGALTCVVPPLHLQRYFGALVAGMYGKLAANQTEAGAVARLRDELLPRLLSGELPVNAAERVVEEVA